MLQCTRLVELIDLLPSNSRAACGKIFCKGYVELIENDQTSLHEQQATSFVFQEILRLRMQCLWHRRLYVLNTSSYFSTNGTPGITSDQDCVAPLDVSFKTNTLGTSRCPKLSTRTQRRCRIPQPTTTGDQINNDRAACW